MLSDIIKVFAYRWLHACKPSFITELTLSSNTPKRQITRRCGITIRADVSIYFHFSGVTSDCCLYVTRNWKVCNSNYLPPTVSHYTNRPQAKTDRTTSATTSAPQVIKEFSEVSM
ncbi:unnamed protein product [Hermetia illucens]|uniref:Uncharacterized protein n=1 Tax=Hermetia illucens TaxID=343691 RepID=A0A7R8UAR9_HERIL|nr:unnamed protein product [Hermetia illucens]